MKYDKIVWCVGNGCPLMKECVHHMALRSFLEEYGGHGYHAIDPKTLLYRRCSGTENFQQWDERAHEEWLYRDLEDWMNKNPT